MCHTNSKADKPVTHTFTTDTHTKAHTHTLTYTENIYMYILAISFLHLVSGFDVYIYIYGSFR